jgi:hypothetical protein
MTTFRYYVSFSFDTHNGTGVGSAELHRNAPISDMTDVRQLADELIQPGMVRLSVLGFSRFDSTSEVDR